jgi:hypothetical protein
MKARLVVKADALTLDLDSVQAGVNKINTILDGQNFNQKLDRITAATPEMALKEVDDPVHKLWTKVNIICKKIDEFQQQQLEQHVQQLAVKATVLLLQCPKKTYFLRIPGSFTADSAILGDSIRDALRDAACGPAVVSNVDFDITKEVGFIFPFLFISQLY